MDPATMLGLGQMGLGVFQSIAGYKAQKQDYLNKKAFQSANNEFAAWQAGFNSKVRDANQQHNYWKETVNHNSQLSYVNALRNVELTKSIRQAEVVAETRAAAGASFISDSEAISQQFEEVSMQDAVATKQYRWRALQARASVQAMGAEGNSVDRIVNDYSRQQGDYEALQQINEGLRTRQYNRTQAAQVAQYISRWNSQQFYEEQPYIDPIAPFAPLPTLITPSGPTMTGGGPSMGAAILNAGSAVLGGVSTYYDVKNKADTLQALKGNN